MALLHADWFRGSFVPMAPNEPIDVFAARMRKRERRVPFRRWRPVWQVQVSSALGPVAVTDEPGSVPILLSGHSSLMRRASAVAEGKRIGAMGWWVRVVDVGTGEVAFINKGE